MNRLTRAFARMAIPDAPEEVRNEFVIHAATQVQKQAKLLFAFLLLTTPLALLAAPDDAPWFVAWGLPLIMAAYCLFGVVQLNRNFAFEDKPWSASRFVIEASISSWFGAAICSLWCVLSWIYAPHDDRLQFPVILVMGAFATAYCLSSIRLGAIAHLAIDIIPISLLLLFSGHTMDAAAGFSLLVGGLFQARMINEHHRYVVCLLTEQRKTRILASTDPLTGLLNRRALTDRVARIPPLTPIRLMLIDIDHFKRINDTHGHEAGDTVLRAIADIVASNAGPNGHAARIGGEEFALIGPAGDLPEATALALLAQIRTYQPRYTAQITASIGIADGIIRENGNWADVYRRADEALYAAKSAGRNRYLNAPADGSHDAHSVQPHRPGADTTTGRRRPRTTSARAGSAAG